MVNQRQFTLDEPCRISHHSPGSRVRVGLGLQIKTATVQSHEGRRVTLLLDEGPTIIISCGALAPHYERNR